MKILKLASLLALAISVVGGCVLISGQVFIDWELDDLTIDQDHIVPYPINLNEEEDYVENKSSLQGLADLAYVGFVTNNSPSSAKATVYLTRSASLYTTKSTLINSDEEILLWGGFSLDANEKNRKIDWDESASLFNDAGYKALVEEIKGDGIFTLYLVGAEDNFDFTTHDNWLMITVDISE